MWIDEMMAFRLLRYSVAAMHRHLEQGHKKLPLVIPLLFYHGPQNPYPYKHPLARLLSRPGGGENAVLSGIPPDGSVIPDYEIKTHKKAALLEYVQKHIRARDINSRLQDIVALLGLAQPTKEQVVGLLKYLAREENTPDSEAFFRNLRAHTPRYRA